MTLPAWARPENDADGNPLPIPRGLDDIAGLRFVDLGVKGTPRRPAKIKKVVCAGPGSDDMDGPSAAWGMNVRQHEDRG